MWLLTAAGHVFTGFLPFPVPVPVPSKDAKEEKDDRFTSAELACLYGPEWEGEYLFPGKA